MKHLLVSILTFYTVSVCYAQSSSITVKPENKSGDLGNGYYMNPVLGGDYPDPTILRDGTDYYMTHSSFDYLPGLVILHSKDLINWQPVSFALKEYLGSVWAPDIVKYEDKYYIYFTVSHKPAYYNYVVWADALTGPWSDPIKLNQGNIDPCHAVGEDGTRWMFLGYGTRVKLSDDGLAVIGESETVYDGWQYPSDWVTACFCLEGPKLRYINGYYYYLNAQGGTAGPPTAHMAVLARSKSIDGPWENSPYNPVVRTWDNNERWWNKGHASLIDTPEGNWNVVYHAYENGYVNLGRQTLIEPVEWTSDGWLRVPENIKSDEAIKKPIPSEQQSGGRHERLGEFRIGLDWKFYKDYDPSRFAVENNALTMQGKGNTPYNSSPLMFVGGDHAYEMEVEIEIDPNTTAGLVLCYNDKFLAGSGVNQTNRYSYRSDGAARRGGHPATNRIWLRLRNDNHVVTGSYSFDGKNWKRDDWGMEVSGYNHNTLYGFQSLLPGLFVSGEGKARFRNFKYIVL